MKKPNLSIEYLDKVYQSPDKEDEDIGTGSNQYQIKNF